MEIKKILLLVCFALVLASINVMAANQNVTQQNITTNLTIYDTPTIGTIVLDDQDAGTANELDPTPASTFLITCEADVEDLDGEANIDAANATFYFQSTGHAAADDDLNHYTNSTCTIDATYGTGDEVWVNCSTYVQFYAEPGTWECNMSVNDSQSLQDSAQDVATMTDLLAIDVAVGDLDFGQLGVGDNTTTTDYTKLITNNGNLNMSLKLNVWGTALNDARSMTCTSGYTEPSDMRVATAATQTYTSRTQLASTNDDGTALPGFTISHATVGATGTTGTLYFGMGVSASGSPTGTCAGNLMFSAVQAA